MLHRSKVRLDRGLAWRGVLRGGGVERGIVFSILLLIVEL